MNGQGVNETENNKNKVGHCENLFNLLEVGNEKGAIPMASPCMIASHANTVGYYSSRSVVVLPSTPSHIKRRGLGFAVRGEAMATEKLGIKVQRNPPESKLQELGVRTWPKWGCPPSKFPWTYSATEKCYLLEGKVKVYPEGHGDEFVEIGAGDFVEFPKGMSCTWDVSAAVDKHYKFE